MVEDISYERPHTHKSHRDMRAESLRELAHSKQSVQLLYNGQTIQGIVVHVDDKTFRHDNQHSYKGYYFHFDDNAPAIFLPLRYVRIDGRRLTLEDKNG